MKQVIKNIIKNCIDFIPKIIFGILVLSILFFQNKTAKAQIENILFQSGDLGDSNTISPEEMVWDFTCPQYDIYGNNIQAGLAWRFTPTHSGYVTAVNFQLFKDSWFSQQLYDTAFLRVALGSGSDVSMPNYLGVAYINVKDLSLSQATTTFIFNPMPYIRQGTPYMLYFTASNIKNKNTNNCLADAYFAARVNPSTWTGAERWFQTAWSYGGTWGLINPTYAPYAHIDFFQILGIDTTDYIQAVSPTIFSQTTTITQQFIYKSNTNPAYIEYSGYERNTNATTTGRFSTSISASVFEQNSYEVLTLPVSGDWTMNYFLKSQTTNEVLATTTNYIVAGNTSYVFSTPNIPSSTYATITPILTIFQTQNCDTYSSSTIQNWVCYGVNALMSGLQVIVNSAVSAAKDMFRKATDLILSVFPFNIFVAVNNAIQGAQATSTDITLTLGGVGLFGGKTFTMYNSSTLAYINNVLGFNYKDFFDKVLWLIAGIMMFETAINLIASLMGEFRSGRRIKDKTT